MAYINDIVNVEALLGHVVTGFRLEPGLGVPEEEQGGEVTDSEYYVLTTDAGDCKIELRVDHNGYYGGWLNGPHDVGGFLPVDGEHREITTDSPFRD